jgi:catechol 2,3-dioxygenase-like lactoylglutathione lyase family enzyme
MSRVAVGHEDVVDSVTSSEPGRMIEAMAMTTALANVRLRYATVKTTDLARSLGFYERVLGLARTKTETDFVQLDAGGTELCVDLADDGELDPRLIFAVDDLPALCQQLHDAGVDIVAGGPDQDWVIVRDPDGNDVVFER